MKTAPLLTLVALGLSASSVSAVIHYVSLSSANPSPPYTTWGTAATNIQQAVDVAAVGELVIVSNGVYAGTLVITNPVVVLSFAGSQYTVIDGYGTNRCVWMTNGVRLDGFTLSNGWGVPEGGGVWCPSANAFITNCVIVGNKTSGGFGSGAHGGTLGNCLLAGNTGTNNSAGAYASTLLNCVVSNNVGGGVNSCTLVNSLVVSNTLYGGGAILSSLYNCTLVGNGFGAADSTLDNCILYYNSVAGGGNYDPPWWAPFYSTLNYCCTTPMPTNGVGNITNVPGFVDLANANLRLQSGSPCINAGNNALVVDTTALDLDRTPRIIGGEVDMGAYEFPYPTTPVIVVQPLSQTVYSGTNVTFIASANGAFPLSWQWLFNGAAIPGQSSSTLTLNLVTTNQAGNYSVVVTNSIGSDTSQVAVLTVSNAAPIITQQPLGQAVAPGNYFTLTVNAVGSLPLFWQWRFNGTAIQAATNSSLSLGPMTSGLAGAYSVLVSNAFGSVPSSDAVVSLATGNISYVWQNSPSPTAPYADWSTAAHSIQDAANAAGAGYQLVVTNGTYAGGVSINTPLMLVSVNGPQVTVIDGGYFNTGVTLTNGASLTGFTLSNGRPGVSCTSTNAFVTNCVIAGNYYSVWYAGGAQGGTLYNCLLTGNSGTNNSGGAYGSTLINCVVSNNVDGGVNSCTLFNTLVISNTQYGGGAILSTLYNCTLAGNAFGAADSTLDNCILYYNSVAGGGNYDPPLWAPFYSTLNYCCTTPMPTNGVGNITNAPLFVDLPNGNLRLGASSPCINAGNNAYVTTTTDLDGNPRIVNGTVDIGAYEYQGSGSRISYAWLDSYGLRTDGSADLIDSDGDGMNNWQEWVCGTNPTNAQSVLRIVSALPTRTNVTVAWQSVAGINYLLERGANPGAPFTVLATNIVGQVGTTSYADTNASSTGPLFYRVGVRYP